MFFRLPVGALLLARLQVAGGVREGVASQTPTAWRQVEGIMGFRKCTSCGHEWATRQELMDDPAVTVVGYQASFRELSAGFFLFNHNDEGCRTTMAIPAGDFFDLYDGPMYDERMSGTKECPEYCLSKDETSSCPVHCECAFVREVLQVVMTWPKRSAA